MVCSLYQINNIFVFISVKSEDMKPNMLCSQAIKSQDRIENETVNPGSSSLEGITPRGWGIFVKPPTYPQRKSPTNHGDISYRFGWGRDAHETSLKTQVIQRVSFKHLYTHSSSLFHVFLHTTCSFNLYEYMLLKRS